MPSFFKALNSQVGRKIVTGITGIALMLFLVLHLLGNLTVFGSSDAFNIYTKGLESLGPLLYIAELGLLFLFIYHALIGISIARKRRKRRPISNKMYKSKGGPSHMNLASKSMALTGLIILIFLVWHLITFKFAPTETIMLDGAEARDLRKLLIETFLSPFYTFSYVIILGLFILHLAHGFWSAFTSLGMRKKSTSHTMQMIAYGFSILLMLGFIFIPLYIYLTGGQGSLISY